MGLFERRNYAMSRFSDTALSRYLHVRTIGKEEIRERMVEWTKTKGVMQ